MGQARLKLLRDGERVEFDFSAPAVHIVAGDREMLAKQSDGSSDSTLIVPRAVRVTLSTVVQAAFPQGMDRKDGRVWAAWLEVIEDEAGARVEVTRGQVQWLHKRLADESVKVNPAMAQWREAVVDYVDGLLAERSEGASQDG